MIDVKARLQAIRQGIDVRKWLRQGKQAVSGLATRSFAIRGLAAGLLARFRRNPAEIAPAQPALAARLAGPRVLAAVVAVLAVVVAGLAGWLFVAGAPKGSSLPDVVIAKLPPSAAQAMPTAEAPPAAVPAETKPAETKPAESKPDEAPTAPSQVAEAKPAEPPGSEKPPEKPADTAAPAPAASPATPAAPSQQVAAASPPAIPGASLNPRKAEPLVPAPDPALVEKGSSGPLPIVGPDGRQPWQVYARPFDRNDHRPRIAVLVSGFRLSATGIEAAINKLPAGVTFAFDPYSRRLNDWMALARAAGHEVLLTLPMEPTDYPRQDPGPYTLLTSLDARQNLDRLQWVLSRVSGYVGVTNYMGSRFTASQSDLLPVLQAIKNRGLLFVDSSPSRESLVSDIAKSLNLPRAVNDRNLDGELNAAGIDKRLADLEAAAKKGTAALGVAAPSPLTIERLLAWIPTLEPRGMVLAPVTAVANLQPEQKPEPRR